MIGSELLSEAIQAQASPKPVGEGLSPDANAVWNHELKSWVVAIGIGILLLLLFAAVERLVGELPTSVLHRIVVYDLMQFSAGVQLEPLERPFSSVMGHYDSGFRLSDSFANAGLRGLFFMRGVLKSSMCHQ
jgi:hypothetical protein